MHWRYRVAVCVVPMIFMAGCAPRPASVSRSALGPMVPDAWSDFVTAAPSTATASEVLNFSTLYYYRPEDPRARNSHYWLRFFPTGAIASFYQLVPGQSHDVQLEAHDGEIRPSLAGRYAVMSRNELRLEWLIPLESGGYGFQQQIATVAPDGSLMIRDTNSWFMKPLRYRPMPVGPMKGTVDW